MILKLFGIADLMVALAFLINRWFDKPSTNWFPDKILLVLAIILIIKGVFFLMTADFASAIDIISGIIIVLSIYITIPLILAAIVFIFLIQKAAFSLIS